MKAIVDETAMHQEYVKGLVVSFTIALFGHLQEMKFSCRKLGRASSGGPEMEKYSF